MMDAQRRDSPPRADGQDHSDEHAARELLDRVATFGEWFSVSRDGYGAPGWVPATTLVEGGDKLDRLISDCAARYQSDNRLVGVSFLLKSYTARLAFPAIACFVTDGRIPDMSTANVALRFLRGRATAVALRDVSMRTGTASSVLHALHATLVDDNLRAITAALQEISRAKPGWLWTIVADACAAAFVHLDDHAGDPTRLRSVADAFIALTGSPLAGRGRITERDGRLVYERTSCCLYFLVPHGTYCDNCSVKASGRRAPTTV